MALSAPPRKSEPSPTEARSSDEVIETPLAREIPEASNDDPGQDPGVESLRADLAARDAELAAARDAGLEAIERLRVALLASEPSLARELVAGTTVAELEASFAAARESLARVRESVRREQALSVGAGAPGRVANDPASAFDKIRSGLSRLAAG